MKIGVLSDIHGNNFALDKVLEVLAKEKVEKLLILGDMCGYYYGTADVLSKLAEWDCIYIKGNHEDLLNDYIQGGEADRLRIEEKYGSSFRSLVGNPDVTRFLLGLPDCETITMGTKKIILSHGSPWSPGLYVYPNRIQEYRQSFEERKEDVVLMGHTHYPMIHAIGNKLLINPGSVGQSRLVGGVAFWGVLNIEKNEVVFEQRAVAYDIQPLINEIMSNDPENEYLLKVIVR